RGGRTNGCARTSPGGRPELARRRGDTVRRRIAASRSPRLRGPASSRPPKRGSRVLYGLYISAAGVMTSSYKQDVIANNLANVETVGFKRNVPAFRQRLPEAQERRPPSDWSDQP